MNSNNWVTELGERVIAAMYEENSGLSYKKRHIIEERFFDAKIAAAMKEVPMCSFKNKYGWCKLDEGHEGQHTVIFLGPED